MRTGFVDKIGGFKVHKRPMGVDFGEVDQNSAPKGVGHTTEGLTEVPDYGNNAPQFTVGREGLYQHRALGRMAGTLRNTSAPPETNRLVRVQYEMVGFSSVKPWLPAVDKQTEMLAALYEFADKELGVPAKHVWPDVQDPGVILATETYRRRKSKFPNEAGWYSHGECPDNEHWDKGSFLYGKIMDGFSEPKLVKAFALIEIDVINGHRKSIELSPFFSERAAVFDWMIKDDEIRRKVKKAMVENRVRVADRKVKEEDVAA